MKLLLAAASALALSYSVAMAASVPSSADVVFLVDESGSMSGEHTFLQNVIDDLDTDLTAAGVGTIHYGVVGFGSSWSGGNPIDRTGNGGALGTYTQAETALGNLVTSGSTEDGYEAIVFALSTFASSLTGTAKNFILVTDEDRDNTLPSATYASVLAALKSAGVILNVVVNNPLYTAGAATAIGISDDYTAYVADGSGGFTESAGGVIGNGAGSTETDYAALALETGGAVWDLNQLRAGGLVAQSFTTAFLDIKVQEVVDQIDEENNTPVVPVPASLWLLLGGFGALFGAKKRPARRRPLMA